jgi:hypothetical protein
MKKKIARENQATQIIRSFIDDFQKVSKKDIGSVDVLKTEASRF